MTSKKQTIINASMSLFNREGYQTPGVDRIAEASGVSKMTFYRHFSDKNDLINLILEEKHKKFIDDITHITNEKKSTKEKLFSIFEYYDNWFDNSEFNGCMFTRAVAELGDINPTINEINSKLKSELISLIRKILLHCIKPEPAERIAFVIVMLIDGAISAMQSNVLESKENPPALIAWMAAKTLIYSEGGDI